MFGPAHHDELARQLPGDRDELALKSRPCTPDNDGFASLFSDNHHGQLLLLLLVLLHHEPVFKTRVLVLFYLVLLLFI